MIYLRTLWDGVKWCHVVHLFANSYFNYFLFALPALGVGKILRKPIVVNYRGGSAAAFLQTWGWLVRRSLRWAKIVIVSSNFLEQIFKNFGITTRIIFNFLDLTKFAPLPYEQRRPRHVVVCRNLEPVYNVENFIRALKIVQDQHVAVSATIYGDGSQAQKLQQLVRDLSLAHVEFGGALPNSLLRERIARAAIMANPSNVDSMPISILEGLAAGTPIVSTAVGGVPYLIRHGWNGFLAPANDPQALATQIMRLLDDHTLWQSLSENGLSYVKQFDRERVVAKWCALYSSLVNAKPKKRVASRQVSVSPQRGWRELLILA